MSEIEELRRKRMQELMREQASGQAQQEMQARLQEQEVERQIKVILGQIMSPEARSRLGNIRTARPDFARQVEVLLIQLYQSRRLPDRLSDEQFREILGKISGSKREMNISRK